MTPDPLLPDIDTRLIEIVTAIEINATNGNTNTYAVKAIKSEIIRMLEALKTDENSVKHFTEWGGSQGSCVPFDRLNELIGKLK